MARLASGGRYGFAQSVFQVGGNGGTALGPLLAAFVVVPDGQRSIAWFALVALAAILVLAGMSRWYAARLGEVRRKPVRSSVEGLPRRKVLVAVLVLMLLVFSKYFYLSSLTSYYTFYLIRSSDSASRTRWSTCSSSSARWRSARPWAARSATGSAASR